MRYFEFKSGLASKNIHFIAANGYPPAAYVSLFKSIKDVYIRSFLLRPLNPDFNNVKLDSWFNFADDLHDYVVQFQPKIVMGHSIGAVIWLLYSLKYNYTFDKIILIDPAIFLPNITFFFNVFRFFRLHKRVHPFILPTLKRQRYFNSKQEIFIKYRSKKIFNLISDTVLLEYIESLFDYKNSQYQIKYSPIWESKIYEYGLLEDKLIWKYLEQILSEITLIRAEFSDICTKKIETMFKSKCSNFRSFELKNTTHLLPLEQPLEVANVINRLI
jgi:pimeloyl-ACP methyl ester carboxylesterase